MFDYFESREYFIDQIWFDYEGIHYTGKGILHWNPETGFHIVANIKRGEIELPFQRVFKSISFETSTMMYLRLSGGTHAILPVFFPDELQLMHGHLSENAKRAIFIEPISVPIKKHWYGSALFELKNSIAFPDSVLVETKIGDGRPSQSFSRDGIHYESEAGLHVIGFQRDKKYLEVSWSLPTDNWTKTECWEYARGFQHSISVLAGQTLELKYREVHRANRTFREVILNQAPVSLGQVCRPFDFIILDREKIIDLASFFVRGQNKADIAKKIFFQMADASEQRTRQGRELLLSTILEAALRTIYDCPFDIDSKKRSSVFNLDQLLARFRGEYLISSEDTRKLWKKITTKVANSHRRLRHRNAHPDWLSARGGSYSKEELEQITNHMIFLSRFYGYMIMGLANFKIEKPMFPLPISEWKPMLTLTIGKPGAEES